MIRKSVMISTFHDLTYGYSTKHCILHMVTRVLMDLSNTENLNYREYHINTNIAGSINNWDAFMTLSSLLLM